MSENNRQTVSPPPARTAGRQRLRWVRRIAWCALAISVVCATVWLALTMALPHPLSHQQRLTYDAPVLQMLDRKGRLIGEADRPRDTIPFALIPPVLVDAVMATEDQRFFSHWGVDPLGLLRATLTNIRAGRLVQGGSTITQQLAKNLYLDGRKTLSRKMQELVLAVWLETRLSKFEILELYLNTVYLGAGVYGVEAAAQTYFGRSARSLTTLQAATLAGLLKAPSRYSPFRDADRARLRAYVVIERMRLSGVLTDAEARAARMSDLGLRDRDAARADRRKRAALMRYVRSSLGGASLPSAPNLVVETSLDLSLQDAAGKALAQALARIGTHGRGLQGAVVVMDHDGRVVALVGGRPGSGSQFNRAVDAARQPGSAFKPFVYLTALLNGLKPTTIVYDIPVSVGGWTPKNAGGRYRGQIPLQRSLERSVNTVAVRLQQQFGAAAVADTAAALGLDAELGAAPSLALGTYETTPLDLASAYVAIANGGRPVTPSVIQRIRTPDGRLLYAERAREVRPVMPQGPVRDLHAMLSGVVARGTGRRARLDGWSAAGKTGTSQDGRDAWFVGFTSHFVAAVWIGTETGDAGSRRISLSGGGAPADVWRDTMTAAHRGLTPDGADDGEPRAVAGPHVYGPHPLPPLPTTQRRRATSNPQIAERRGWSRMAPGLRSAPAQPAAGLRRRRPGTETARRPVDEPEQSLGRSAAGLARRADDARDAARLSDLSAIIADQRMGLGGAELPVRDRGTQISAPYR